MKANHRRSYQLNRKCGFAWTFSVRLDPPPPEFPLALCVAIDGFRFLAATRHDAAHLIRWYRRVTARAIPRRVRNVATLATANA